MFFAFTEQVERLFGLAWNVIFYHYHRALCFIFFRFLTSAARD